MRLLSWVVIAGLLSVVMLVPGTGAVSHAQDDTLVIFQEMDESMYDDANGPLYCVPLAGGETVQLTPDEVKIVEFEVTDSGYIVYLDDQDALFSVPVTGGSVVALSGNNVRPDYRVSGNGEYVVYVQDLVLYSAPVVGGDPIRLSPEGLEMYSEPYGLQSNFIISPDNQHVVFTATETPSGRSPNRIFQLYTVPIGGGEAIQLNSRLSSGGNVTSFTIAPDAAMVVYRADQVSDEAFGLFSVPTAGGEVTQLTPNDLQASRWTRYMILANNRVVFYIPERDTVFAVDMAGGEVVELADDNWRAWQWTAAAADDGSVIVPSETIDGLVFNQFPSTGGSVTLEIATQSSGHFRQLPDGSMLIGHRFPEIGGWDEAAIYRYPADGGDFEVVGWRVREVSGDEIYFPTRESWNYYAVLSPDNQYLVTYGRVDEELPVPQFFSVYLPTNEWARLSEVSGSSGFGGVMFRITADSTRVVYLNDEDDQEIGDLYTVPIVGGDVVRLTTDDTMGVVDFQLYPRGTPWHISDRGYRP
ncbi:MAG: hypothetical protein GYB65_11440 [Chloroflexi bacterium]|nr:hypothetical protein [Chloroflexota bacterium]